MLLHDPPSFHLHAQIQVFNLSFSVVRQSLFLCRFNKMSGIKFGASASGLLQSHFLYDFFPSALYLLLASTGITNSLGSSITGWCLATHCLKFLYAVASDVFSPLKNCFIKATQTATIHKSTFRLITSKLYLTARQYTYFFAFRINKSR